MNICVCVRGSIAAYKSVEFIRKLISNNHKVKVILSSKAKKFVTPTTIETFTGEKVINDQSFSEEHLGTEHISIARWADKIIVYGATADFIAKIKSGRTDDFSSLQISAIKPEKVYIAPAMNPQMWLSPANQENINTLKNWNYNLIGPEEGIVACGEQGIGHISNNEKIINSFNVKTKNTASKIKILISMGSMKSTIDPARFIQNSSSGLTGLEFFKAFNKKGFEPTIICGPIKSKVEEKLNNICAEIYRYETFEEYQKLVKKLWNQHSMFISIAAVLDFIVIKRKDKLKRKELQKENSIAFKIKETEDITKWCVQNKNPNQKVICFGLQSGDKQEVLKNAYKKLQNKSADVIIANPTESDLGPDSINNSYYLLEKDNPTPILEIENKPKSKLAKHVVNFLIEKCCQKDDNKNFKSIQQSI